MPDNNNRKNINQGRQGQGQQGQGQQGQGQQGQGQQGQDFEREKQKQGQVGGKQGSEVERGKQQRDPMRQGGHDQNVDELDKGVSSGDEEIKEDEEDERITQRNVRPDVDQDK
jgi:hypothetical protein